MILGRRIKLRAIEKEDLEILWAWRNDPEESKYFYEYEPISLIQHKTWFEKILENPFEKLWLAEKIDDACLVGRVGLSHIDWRNRNAELSRFLIINPYKNADFGTELLSLTLYYFFEHLNMYRIYLDTFSKNTQAILFYQKMGFKIEGTLRKHVFRNGNYQDLEFMGMLREEYLSEEVQSIIKKNIQVKDFCDAEIKSYNPSI